MLALLFSGPLVQAQHDWLNNAPDGNWRRGVDGQRWTDGSWDEPASWAALRFNNDRFLTMTNNVPSTYNRPGLIFGASHNGVRTISGANNIVRLFDTDNGNIDPYIENLDDNTHVISFPLEGDGDSGDPLRVLIQSSGGLTFNGTINNRGSSINVQGNTGSAATVTFNGVISGAGGLFKDNANTTVVLAASNSYSGQTTLEGGTLSITNANSLGSARMRIGNGSVFSRFLVNSNTSRSPALAIQSGAANAVIEVASGVTYTQSGALEHDNGTANTTKFGKAGAGTLVLSGTGSTYNGQMQIGQGTVIIGQSGSYSVNSGTSQRAIDLGLSVSDASQSNAVAVLASNGVTISNSFYIAPNTSSAARTIGIAGSGTNTFNAEFFMDGVLTVDAGSSATDRVNISGNLVNSNGGIIKTNAGILALSGANTFTNGVNLGQGTLLINNAAALGAVTSRFTVSGSSTIDNTTAGALTLSNYPQTWNADFTFTGTQSLNMGTGAVTLGATRQVTVSANTLTIGGIIGDGGNARGLTKAGNGVLVLGGENTYTGTTTINAGTLQMNGNNRIANGSAVTLGGGTLQAAGTVTDSMGALNVTANSTIDMGSGDADLTFASLTGVTGTLSITNFNAGIDTVVFTNTSNVTEANLNQITVNGAMSGLSGTNLIAASAAAAPTGLAVTTGVRQLTVGFTAPASNGGRGITNYQFSTDGGTNWTAVSPASTSTNITIANLANNTAYNVQVRALTAFGNGTASTNASATTFALPSAPTITSISAGSQQLTVNFTAGANGGSAIANYQYSTDGGSTWRNRATGTTASPLTITTLSSDGTTALSNGTSYPIQIRAVSAVGEGAPTPSTSATPVAAAIAPAAPTALVATPGNASLSIAFTPGSDGGAAITNYEYSFDNSTWTAFSPVDTETPVVISGLTNGTAYTVYLRARNSVGPGTASSGVSGTPRTTPGAPTIGTITPGNGQLSVAFTAPASDGGSAITEYKWSVDGTTYTSRAGTANPIVITGLTNGTAYTVRILAVNAAGDGTVATAGATATPSTTPGTPTSVAITPGNAQLSVAFTAPSNGGSAITDYDYSTDGGSNFKSGSTNASPIVITTVSGSSAALTNGTSYNVQIRARNANGTGTPTTSTAATPRTVPGAPTIGTITPGNGQLSVAFTAPASDGGSAITGYKWSIDGSNYTLRAGTTNPIVITGLTNGTAYTVRILAVNDAGDGAVATAGSTATPRGAPTVTTTSPPAANIGSTGATLGGNVTATNGATITERGVFYSTTNGFADGTGTKVSTTGTFGTGAFSNTVTGLSKQTTYYFKAFAANAAGTNYGSQVSFSTLRAPDGRNPISNTNPTNAFLGDLDIQLFARAWRDFNVDGGATWTPRGFATIFGRFNNPDLTTNTVQGTGRDPGSADEDFFARTPLFTQTGTFYWAMRVSYGSGNNYFYDRSMTDWLPLATTLPQTATLAIEVLPLNTPTNQVATAASSTSVNLGWTPGNSGGARWTMIVRSTDTNFTAPTNGTGYAVGNTNLGGDRVIFFGSGTTTNTTDDGLNANTTYYYRFYSENNAYYSAGVDANATTTGSPVISIQGSTNNATAAAFTTTYGTASAAQTFTIAGSNLTENITTGTAPSGFELSTNGSSWTTNAQTFTRSGSTASGTLHLRLATNAPVAGTYNSRTISVASGGVTNNIVTAASSNSVNPRTLRVTVGNQNVFFGYPASNNTVIPSESVLAQGSFTVNTNDLVNNDGTNVVTGTPVYSTTYVQGDANTVTNRTISVSGLTSANYTITPTAGTVTILPLGAPTSFTATAQGHSQINTTWNRFTSNSSTFNVMLVRREGGAVTLTPSNGVVYTNNQDVSGNIVLLGSAATNALSNSNLTANTTYHYSIFSENWGYYSAGATANAATDANYTFDVPSGTQTNSATLTGPGSLTKSGNGELLLTANNSTYSGGTVISAGTLRINHDRGLGAVPTTATANSIQIGNATLALDGTITLNSNRGITLSGNATIDDWGDNDVYNGIIATATGATTSLTKTGGGNLTLGGSNSYTGLTTVNNGTLTITHASALGATGAGNGTVVSTNTALRLSGNISVTNEPLTLGGTGVGGVGGALKSVSGNNSWSGNLTVSSNTRIDADDGTLTVSGAIASSNNVLFIGDAGNVTLSGAISGAGSTQNETTTSLYKSGDGTLTLSASNSYTGDTRISRGRVIANATGSLGTGSGADVRIALNGALTVNTNVTVASIREWGTTNGGTATIATGATLTINGNNKGTFYMNSISGSGGNLTFSGTGTSRMQLFGTQGYTGITTISSGILGVQSGTTLATSEIRIAAGAEFSTLHNTTDATSYNIASPKILAATSTSGTATVTVGTGATLTMASGSSLRFAATGTTTASVGKVSVTGNVALNSNAVEVVVTGAALPAGTYVLMDTTGTLTGTPGTVTVTSLAAGHGARLSTSANSLSLIVAPLPVVTASTFDGTVGTAFSQSISATQSPTSFAVTSGTLPAGLSLNPSTGAITGTPTTAATETTIQVTATNAAGTSSAATITFNITAASLPTVIFTAPASLVYSGVAKTYTASASGVTLTLTYTGRNSTTYNSTTAPTNVGDYTVTASTSNTNYTGSQAQNFSITAKGLTGSFVAASKEYDGNTTAIVTKRSLTGVETGDTVTLEGGTATFDDANAGTGKTVTLIDASLTGAAASNYSLTSVATTTANITKATPTITTAPTATAISVGQALSASTLSGGVATGVGGSVLGGAFAFTSPETTPGVGTANQSVTFTPTDTTNYNTATTSASVTVNSSIPVVTASTFSGTVGVAFNQSISATGSPTSYAVSSGTLPAGLSLNATNGAITGTPTAAVSGATVQVTATNSNGTSEAATITFNIAKGSSTVAVTGSTIFTYNGSAQGPATVSSSGSTGAVTFSYSGSGFGPSATPPTNVGSYSVTATLAEDANYNGATSALQVFSITAASLPSTTFTQGANGVFTASAPGVTNWNYLYVGRTNIPGLNTNSYAFLTYSNTNAPTAPGFYTVTATSADPNFTGSTNEHYAISGPLSKLIEVTKVQGTTNARFTRLALLGTVQRVDTNGVLHTGATNLVWTNGTTGGVSQMPSGHEPMTMSNSVTFDTNFVRLAPPGNGASLTDSFTLRVTDGHTPVDFPVTVTSTALPPFELQARRMIPNGDGTMTAIFVTRPNRNIEMMFRTNIASTNWAYVTSTSNVVQVDGGLQPQNLLDGNHQPRGTNIPTGQSGVIQLKVPAGGQMFFRARQVTP